MGKNDKCSHPGTYHLGSDGLTIVKPHPQAETCFAREQGYIVAKVEPAYADLAQRMGRACGVGSTQCVFTLFRSDTSSHE